MRDEPDIWYRVEVRHYSVADEWGDYAYTSTDVSVEKFHLVRATPRGVWLRGFMTGEFFVKGDALRQRAVPTLDLAYADALARKEWHIAGCKARLHQAEKDREVLASRRNRDVPRDVKPLETSIEDRGNGLDILFDLPG